MLYTRDSVIYFELSGHVSLIATNISVGGFESGRFFSAHRIFNLKLVAI